MGIFLPCDLNIAQDFIFPRLCRKCLVVAFCFEDDCWFAQIVRKIPAVGFEVSSFSLEAEMIERSELPNPLLDLLFAIGETKSITGFFSNLIFSFFHA